jgi:S-adenosylmethionine:tRNA ribosyltransferase-isomerase
MRPSDFYYELPEELIAQYPPEKRSDSRLLCLDGATGRLQDHCFSELPELLRSGDLLVFNDTQVMRARLFGRKASGGKVEVLVERVLDDRRVLALVRVSKSPKPGTRIRLEGEGEIEVIGQHDELYELRFIGESTVEEVMNTLGHVPLPPYINRADEAVDAERYQTVYAHRPGAVAAPTAGLHFDEGLMERLDKRGVRMAFITLHVGSGTFQPIRTEWIEDHCMHQEYVEVSREVCAQVGQARAHGGRVVAVGSTSVRALETASAGGKLSPYAGETEIFIYPGYKFLSVDAMITNFHLPESTLLMLVCAFAGREQVLSAYRHAVRERYRFYSYGDAMLVTPHAI